MHLIRVAALGLALLSTGEAFASSREKQILVLSNALPGTIVVWRNGLSTAIAVVCAEETIAFTDKDKCASTTRSIEEMVEEFADYHLETYFEADLLPPQSYYQMVGYVPTE